MVPFELLNTLTWVNDDLTGDAFYEVELSFYVLKYLGYSQIAAQNKCYKWHTSWVFYCLSKRLVKIFEPGKLA